MFCGLRRLVLIEQRPARKIFNSSTQDVRQHIARRVRNIGRSSHRDRARAKVAQLICLHRHRHAGSIDCRIDSVSSAVGKFLRRMMPILVLMLLVNQMDRTNVGFVQDELRADVGVSATAYGLGAGGCHRNRHRAWPSRNLQHRGALPPRGCGTNSPTQR